MKIGINFNLDIGMMTRAVYMLAFDMLEAQSQPLTLKGLKLVCEDLNRKTILDILRRFYIQHGIKHNCNCVNELMVNHPSSDADQLELWSDISYIIRLRLCI